MAADLTSAEPLTGALGDNIVPGKYRGVAVSRLDIPLDAPSFTGHLLGKSAYRRTRFVVARSGPDTAVAQVWRDDPDALFAPITRVRVIAEPGDCAYVHSPETDTAIPSALAQAAAAAPTGRSAVVVQGRYEHVSFIVNPRPLRIAVREITPPDPPKLLDQARRVLAVIEDLPPIELVPDIVRLADLAAAHPSDCYLVPCRGSGFSPPDAEVYYLDEHPPEHRWTLIGPERSQQIHESFYGDRADDAIDICPCQRPPVDGPLLTKCSQLEHEIRADDGQVTVPWGASLSQVEQALRALARAWEPSWERV
ncbi:DUF7714 family protein [Leekyejoonella antrihumi]|uniref:Uncharacterized protein n=1 Tax=Leekyejoonella antrihumi TaxID=1660198 RepID=A0A563E699_9MICO|nr:hypothetical protein [Leekyejoonella antrihumi]TWP38037.1 hypothetical protein FGL98_04855 [Leekyejoonella antrihumi]